MPLSRLDNLISSKTGKYLYVSPDDFNATDALSNRGNSPVVPFKSIQRAFLEIARYSYLPGFGNDRFDQFTIMLMPGIHYIDNRPGLIDTSGVDIFGFDQANNAWTDDSITDLSNPNNIYYKFNNTEGGAIIPRGSSLVGYDLRRTVVRPLFVPDPAVTEREIPRSAMFNVTGGCYFWQFTLKDGQTTSESPLYDAAAGTGKVYYDPTDFTKLAAPNYSHHKLTVFEYADTDELNLFYRKIAKAFSAYQPTIDDPGEFDTRVQENRIVGPLSDSRIIESLTLTDATTDPSIPASTTEVTVTTKVDHGYFQGQFVAIANTEIDDVLEGIFEIKEIDQNDARKFKYLVPFVTSGIGSNIVSGQTVSVDTTPALGQNAQTLAEVDSVESASPYVFNVSIRSTWGICGIWANGLKATGFKSMVIAQYTGVSLQKDDRAFIRYDEYTNTWNQASLVDAFATVPYHTKGDAYYKDEWRNFHVRASEDSFIQCVSIFAVGFADHFLMESGGDMSITNSNSNFGNTSLHAIGFKGFAFNQDKGGFITDIIPPKTVVDNTASTKKISYYTIDIQGTLSTSQNYTKLFLGNEDIVDPLVRPAATIDGYRLGAKSDDKLYVKLDPAPGTDEFFNASLEPTGFVKYIAKGSILNPSGGVVNSVYADAANLIESNRRMIQEEVFGYILEKYPRLQNIPYVNPGLDPAGNRYFDARNLIAANRQYIVDTAFDDMIRTYGSTVIQGIGDGKCKRDIGLIVDAVAEDLRDGGNSNIIAATREYFDGDGNPLTNGLVGEEDYATYAFRRARDLCKLAIANLLPNKADLYDPDPNSNLAPYGINIGKTGSQAELDGDTTNGVTIDLALKSDPASRYKDARNRIVANKEFILDAAVAEISVYHPDFYHPTDTQTNSQSRLADAFRLIRRNSSEIRDKALAQIAVDHPNFYIDGDQQTDEGSRYASAYRLISKNRDQIVDTALAETTVQHPDYYFVGDQVTDARSRYADGYRLIVQNRVEIVNSAWNDTFVQYPNHGQYEAKCKRDLDIFVEAIGLDLFVGGNKYSRKFISEYFNAAGTAWIVGGLQGEEAESVFAYNKARDYMKLAVANQLSVQDLSVTPGPAQYGGGGGDIANNNSNACDDVQSAIVTLTDIVTAQITAGNLSALPAETSYISGPGEEKCRRDIGIFVDSVALDLFCLGNVYSHRFAAEFFVNETTPEFSFNSAVYNTNFNKARDMIKKAITNQLYFKDNGTQGAIDRTADNAPGSAYGQVSKDFTPHGAAYTASTGELVLDIANHGLSTGDRVKIADNALTFTCGMDGDYSNHTYPRSTDPASGQYIEITSATTDSITVNVGASPAVTFTPTAGTYDAATGLLVLTIGAHTLTTGTNIKIADNSLNFKCSMDDYGTVHSYPRVTDPVSGEAIEITAVTADSITVNVGQSPLVQFTPTNASFTPTTGIMELTIGDHSLRGADRYTPSTAAYNPTSGIMTITIANHGFANGNVVRIDDDALTFTCGQDSNATNHSYPRSTDPVSGMWIPISNVTQNTFDVQVLRDAPSTNTTPHAFVSAAANSVTFPRDSIKLADGAVTFTCDQDSNATNHSYPRTTIETATVTGADYDPQTGVMEITIANHGLKNNEQIKFADDSLTFTCLLDNNVTNHTYPRSTDPVSDKWLKIFNVQTNTFQVQVLDNIPSTNTTTHTFVSATTNGLSYKKDPFYDNSIYIEEVPSTAATVTNATYNGATGVMVITSAGHGLSNGNKIKFELGSLTFSCTKDGNATNHSYPRITDPSYDEWLTVANKTNDTFEVNVGISGPNDQYAHTFVSATASGLLKQSGTIKVFIGVSSNSTTHSFVSAVANSVKTGGTYTHVWAGADANAVTSGGDYPHTFVSSATNAVNFGGNTENELTDAQPFLCSDVQSAVDSLTSIVTTILANGNLSTMPIEVNYGTGRGPGEVKCARDLGYFIDAISVDMYHEGNKHTREYTEQYFTNATTPLPNGLQGEESESITAYNTAIGEMKKAITNQLYYKDLTVTEGGSTYAGSTTDVGTPTNVTYDATTGTLVTTITGHGLANGDKIKFLENSLVLSCTMDGNTANKTYPRPTDPTFNTWLTVANKTNDTFEVNVGTSPIVTYTPTTGTTYDPNTGLMVLEIGNHNLTAGTSIKLAPNSLTFSCGFGGATGAAAEKSYPRSNGNDPFYDTAINIQSVTGTTITLQVLQNVPSTNTDPHTFVSATSGAVIAGGNYVHTFVSATANAVRKQNSAITSRTSSSACSDVQSAIDTLGTIVTDAIAAGNITGGIWNNAANPGTLIPGEAKCRRDLGIVVEAVAQDLWFGGNEFSIAATKEYFKGNQLIANGVDNEVAPSITAFKRAEDLMQRALNNQYYDRDLNITLDTIGDPPIVGDIECDAHDMVISNQLFIAKEAYERMKAAYPLYTPSTGNTAQDCLDDIYDVLRDVMWDVKFGGNYKTYSIAKGYITNDFNGKTYPQIIQDVERDEVAKVFQEVKNVAIQVIKNEAVTVSSGNNLTQVIDNTIVDDWDDEELLPKCGSAVAAVDSLMDIIIGAIGTDAGVGNLNGVQRTTADGADPGWNTSLNILSATATSITINVGPSPAGEQYAHTFVAAQSGAVISGGNYDHTFVSASTGAVNVVNGSQITPTNATYDATTGIMVLYFGTKHGVTTADLLSIDDNSLTFTCSMDNNGSSKTYPRTSDPIRGQNVNPTAVTDYSISINVGTSPLVEYNVSNAIYDQTTGSLALTIGNHSLPSGTSIKLKEESLIFTCTKDQNKTSHAYPRSAGKYQPTAYQDGNCSDVCATVNALTDILCNSINDGNLDNLPPLSNGEWDCANVRASIETLFDILNDAITDGTLAGLPVLNTGDFTINNEASKCFRDVTYIVDAVVNDLRLGGNLNSIQAGEAYYVGNNLEYIDGEKTETLDAWDYVGQMATAAMRNFDVLAYNCSTNSGSAIVDVNDTRGIIIGMSVVEYTAGSYRDGDNAPGLLGSSPTPVYTTIPQGTYVKRIISNTQIELGVKGSRLTEGVTVNALQNSTTIDLYFVYENGIWADTLPTTVTVGPESEGPEVIADTTVSPSSRECAGTANAIETLVGNITTIINSGLGTVTRQEQTVNTALLSSRATLFTIDVAGTGPSNPHNFETGTPVRLVPRPRFDQVTGKYVDVDKRLVRLPNGFETNRTYYVIAPGRVTQPENYGATTLFNGSDQTRLMLATSKENAAAGIYIYASETDSIDKDVEIDLYQFVLDDKYDLHNYSAELTNTVNAGIMTNVSHIFDVPNAGTTPQKAFIRAVEGGVLPLVSTTYANDSSVAVTDPQNSAIGRINPNAEFFTRYQNSKVITLHKTHADAINNVNPITFASGQSGTKFDVFANKRRSPMKFDPGFTDATATSGKWYIQCKDEVTGQPDNVKKNNIFWRIKESDYADRQRSTDMWYQRLEDNRVADERTYKLRMVIPSYLQNARDPINGFVLKTRTDDTRKLVPQKILLKPVVGSVYGARFQNPVDASEFIGDTSGTYDPYKRDTTGSGIEYRAFAKFTSGIQATIQSGRRVKDILDDSIEYLELTLFDHGVDTKNFPGLRNETFTTVKITSPQGGNFVTSKVDNLASSTNAVSFAGNSSGLANIHAYYTINGEHYIIIKNIRGGDLVYSEYANTRFTQGTVFADMLEDQDMGKSLPLKTQIAKNNPQFFYKQNGANVYTITPGDKIQDDAGVEYYVDSVDDVGVIEDTFYIFGYETLQQRISGQQDGIYYLTALRGNISPFPTGAGVTNNFKKFKFSQPVGKLYPLNYRNDPLWFNNSGTTQKEKDYYAGLIDPPQAYSAADNYVHGAVTVNDFKGSTTREMVADLTEQPAFIERTYTIQAQSGNAASGSEQRKIPIGGSGAVSITDTKYYVELRRPSIARAGNHTFEYLGFGPGNYSTGLPARQEVVLTPDEDFYAQSKKQDGGIVFYTGINSQGDLYIGNRRINAITGEETFIDRATLVDDGDEDDTLGGLVTTFDTPVTFNQNITVVGGDGELVNTFESPITIAVQDSDLTQARDALIIRSNVTSVDPVTQLEQDEGLDRTSFSPPTEGDIRISKNTIKSAVFQFNARGNGQGYLFQTHTVAGVASNITPNQSPLIANGGSRINAGQFVNYGGVLARTGDVLLKGSEIGKSGSLGWILANYFAQIANNSIDNIVFDGSNVVKLEFRDFNSGVALTNTEIGITSASQIRIKNFYYDPRLNLTWQIYAAKPGDPFSPTNNYCHFQVIDQIPQATQPWETIISGTAVGATAPTIEFSNSNFKEVGVLGGEALRTETETIGDYKLGINTVARAPHSSYENAFVDNLTTDPRANLDVVGTAFISGRTTADFLQHTNFADRDKTAVDNAFLVGGDSANPSDISVFRIATTNSGRVGINVSNANLDRALVVVGTSRFTADARFEHDIEVNGDGVIAEIRTSQTTGTFNLVDDTTFVGTLNIGSQVTTANLFNDSTADQFINIGRSSAHSNIWLGVTPDSAGTAISKVEIGGAYANTNEDLSYTKIKTRNLRVDGDMWLGFRKGSGDTVELKSQASQVDYFSNSGGPSIINFATNASEINIAGQGGKTTINNQLEVIASAKFNGDVHLCGGVASFAFTGGRAQLGTDIVSHEDGIISQALFNKNVDILNVLVKQTNEEGYNQVDTAGAGEWGGTSYQNSINTGGSVEPITLSVLSGDEYYLPLKFAPVKANGDPYFGTNDYIIVDSQVVGTGSSATGHPEILQIVELTRISEAPYYIKVKRRPFGAFGGVLTNHIDTTAIYKVNVQFDATWTEQALDNDTSATDSVYLSEFGGNLTSNDYIIVDRDDSPKVPEYIKVITSLDQQVQKFRVSNCADPDLDVFEVNSVTGEVQIGNPAVPGSIVTINSSLNMSGGCGTLSDITFLGDAAAGSRVITNVSVTTSGKTIADIKKGDVLSVITDSSPLKIAQDTAVDFVFGGAIYLSDVIIGAQAVTGTTFKVSRNERITATDGAANTTFDVDTCSGTTTIGTHAGRFDVNLAWSNGPGILTNANLPAELNLDDIIVYGYYADPQTIQGNGPSTTIISTATGNSASVLQIAVQSLGEGTGKFTIGDLIAVGPLVSFTNNTGQIEFMTITSVVDATNTIIATRAQEGTVNMSHSAADVVRRVIKHERQSLVVDAQIRQRLVAGVSNDYLSVILERGYISQQKLDYRQWLRFSNTSTGTETFGIVQGRLYGKTHSSVMDEQIGDGARSYRNGSLEVTDNLTLAGGNFTIYDSVKQTKLFQFVNDDGHADHSGLLYWDAGVLARGDFFLYPTSCPENVLTTLQCDPSFSVDNLGNVTAQNTLTITGTASPSPTESDVFSVQNLGINGGSEYTIKQDRSIDAFGLTNFTTSTGARHTRYLSAASPEADLTLIANIIYMVNIQNTQTLIVTLPGSPQTGDVIRMIDVGGNLKYDTTLVLRTPETSGTPIQGDSTGTLFGDRLTPYPSGELVVQTPNAAFALVYLGAVDSNDQIGIPTSVQGWWLMEV